MPRMRQRPDTTFSITGLALHVPLARSKRVLACALAASLLGVLTNFAVAWACSYRAEGLPAWGSSSSTIGSYRWASASSRASAATIHTYRWPGLTYVRFFRRAHDDYYVRDARPLTAVAPAWSQAMMPDLLDRLPALPADADPWTFRRTTPDLLIAAGWPLPSFACHARSMFALDMAAFPEDSDWTGAGVEKVISSGLSMPRGLRDADAGYALWQPFNLRVPLPYRPLWRGLLINSALYSLAWAALISAFILTRSWYRARRHRAGCCTQCGYDLKGLATHVPCPECGKQRVAPTP